MRWERAGLLVEREGFSMSKEEEEMEISDTVEWFANLVVDILVLGFGVVFGVVYRCGLWCGLWCLLLW